MRKYYFILLTILIVLSSCEGAQGPTGDRGAANFLVWSTNGYLNNRILANDVWIIQIDKQYWINKRFEQVLIHPTAQDKEVIALVRGQQYRSYETHIAIPYDELIENWHYIIIILPVAKMIPGRLSEVYEQYGISP